MSRFTWLAVCLIGGLAAGYLVTRGLLAMHPGGSGALNCFAAALAIVGVVAWAYRHRGEAR